VIGPDSARSAEAFRRRHCDGTKTDGPHRCVGTITLKPGLCLFDCPLCGSEHLDLRPAMDAMDALEEARKKDDEEFIALMRRRLSC